MNFGHLVESAQRVAVALVRPRQAKSKLHPKGRFFIEHWRNGDLLGKIDITNGITDEGKAALLDLTFGAGSVTASNYIGLVDDNPVFADADTYTSHAGWTEFTNYKVAAANERGQWSPGAATGTGTVSITNAAPITFDIDGAGGTIAGIFVVQGVTAEIEIQGDTTGGNILWSTALFASGDVPTISGDQLKVTYTLSA